MEQMEEEKKQTGFTQTKISRLFLNMNGSCPLTKANREKRAECFPPHVNIISKTIYKHINLS
jgi:hypothetical protein